MANDIRPNPLSLIERRLTELEETIAHVERVRAQLEARRMSARPSELPNIEELLSMNHERLVLLRAAKAKIEADYDRQMEVNPALLHVD